MDKNLRSELATKNEQNLYFYINLVAFVFFFILSFFVNDNGFEIFKPLASYGVLFGSIFGLLLGSVSYRYGNISVKKKNINLNFTLLILGLIIILVIPSFFKQENASIIVLNGILGILLISCFDLAIVSIKMLYTYIGMPYKK